MREGGEEARELLVQQRRGCDKVEVAEDEERVGEDENAEQRGIQREGLETVGN